MPVSFTESDPVRVLNDWETKNQSKARQALKVGLLDFISQIKHYSEDLKSAIDADLIANSLPDLLELSNAKEKLITKVLNKQKILNANEYSVVKEEVSDVDSKLNSDERLILEKAISQFEQSQRK